MAELGEWGLAPIGRDKWRRSVCWALRPERAAGGNNVANQEFLQRSFRIKMA